MFKRVYVNLFSIKFIDNKIKHYKNDDKTHKKKSNSNDIKKDKINKNDSVTEIQVSDLDNSVKYNTLILLVGAIYLKYLPHQRIVIQVKQMKLND